MSSVANFLSVSRTANLRCIMHFRSSQHSLRYKYFEREPWHSSKDLISIHYSWTSKYYTGNAILSKWTMERVKMLQDFNDETVGMFGPVVTVTNSKRDSKKSSCVNTKSKQVSVSSSNSKSTYSSSAQSTMLTSDPNDQPLAISQTISSQHSENRGTNKRNDERCDYEELPCPPPALTAYKELPVAKLSINDTNQKISRDEVLTCPVEIKSETINLVKNNLSVANAASNEGNFLSTVLHFPLFKSSEQTFAVNSMNKATDGISLMQAEAENGRNFRLNSDAKELSGLATNWSYVSANSRDSFPVLSKSTISHCPSVSAILNETMPSESRAALERWMNKMIQELGKEGFTKYKEETFAKGTRLHNTIQCYLSGLSCEIDATNEGHWLSIERTLYDISDVIGQEMKVKHNDLQYRGILDCIAHYRGVPSLIEWKTAKRAKPELRHTYDNPLQLVAYLGAYNNTITEPGEQIQQCLLVVCHEDGSAADVHVIDRVSCIRYWKNWLRRVHEYWTTRLPCDIPLKT